MKRSAVQWLVVLIIVSALFALPGSVDDGRAQDASYAPSDAAKMAPVLSVLLSTRDGDTQPERFSLYNGDDDYGFQYTISPTTGERLVGVLVQTRNSTTGRTLLGIPITAKAGSIVALSVTLSQLLDLARSDDVVYIEPSWKTRPTLDVSVPAIGADTAHAEPLAAVGEDVAIGIVDTGIDYTHLDFRVDEDGDGVEEGSRILALWDQTLGLFGTAYRRADIESDLAYGYGPSAGIVRSSDTNGHGTHVAGIAAGDGSSSSAGFVGVAPGSTLVVVKTTFYTSDILAAVEYVFDQADAAGLPAVVNLSLGGHEGPHDGTSLFEQGLDELADAPGRAIVVSAGNEGDLDIHAAGTLSGGFDSFDIVPDESTVELTLWYPGTSQFTVVVVPPSDAAVAATTGMKSGHVATIDGIVYVDNASSGINPNNGDREVYIRLSSVATGSTWEVRIEDVSGGGRFDAWILSEAAHINGGDSSMTIDEPGNANDVITVGAYTTKLTWPSMAGTQDFSGVYPLNDLAPFSSRGPTRDGRTKPDVCAPGAFICSALSSTASPLAYLTHTDGMHTIELGTSMAAPHVSGTIALLLSRDSGLTTTEIKQILHTTSMQDSYTGSIPSLSWGWGKIDAASAVARVDEIAPPDDPDSDPPEKPEVSVAENPAERTAQFLLDIPAEARTATLRIYTVSGNLVFETSLATRATEYEWNLLTTRQDPLAGGLYLYVVVTDQGTSDVGKLVIKR